MAQMVRNLPPMQQTRVRSLGQDSTEESMATHSSILNVENSMDRGACQATVHGVAESGTTETQLSTPGERGWELS